MDALILIVAAIVWLIDAIWKFTEYVMGHLTGETARRKRREEEARKEEEERQQRQRERQQKRQQAEAKKREQFHTKNSEVFAGIADLLSNCGAPAVEIMRAAGAIEGKDFERNPKDVVWADVAQILTSFRKSGSTGDAYIENLWEEVIRTIKPPDVDDIRPLSDIPNHGVKKLGMVSLLVVYDKQRGTTLSSKAATAYLSIVSAVSSHCGNSLAAKMVADKYTALLSPYIHDSGGDGDAGSSTSSTRNNSDRKSVCEKCVKGYQLLDLPLGASEDEVKQKRVALAQVLHPDHTGGMGKRTRDTAEEQLKSINVAYDHILECRFSG